MPLGPDSPSCRRLWHSSTRNVVAECWGALPPWKIASLVNDVQWRLFKDAPLGKGHLVAGRWGNGVAYEAFKMGLCTEDGLGEALAKIHSVTSESRKKGKQRKEWEKEPLQTDLSRNGYWLLGIWEDRVGKGLLELVPDGPMDGVSATLYLQDFHNLPDPASFVVLFDREPDLEAIEKHRQKPSSQRGVMLLPGALQFVVSADPVLFEAPITSPKES